MRMKLPNLSMARNVTSCPTVSAAKGRGSCSCELGKEPRSLRSNGQIAVARRVSRWRTGTNPTTCYKFNPDARDCSAWTMPYIPSGYAVARLSSSHPVRALISYILWIYASVSRRSFLSMSVSLFPDQLPDTRGLIRRAHEAKKRTVLVKSFFEKAYSALRAEVWNLPRDIRNQIPPFNSINDLSERHAASKIQRVEVSSALLVIAEIANFIGYVRTATTDEAYR